jgi:Glutamate/Leucine/Phenylalanine/Valine dehydrogenase
MASKRQSVTVSYFEWVQNIENEKWDEAEVNSKLKTKMGQAADALYPLENSVVELRSHNYSPTLRLHSGCSYCAKSDEFTCDSLRRESGETFCRNKLVKVT